MSGLTIHELMELICEGEAVMGAADRRLWDVVRTVPAKWNLHPRADEIDGFWVVGVIGPQAIWYNEIEGGFNVSRYVEYGIIDEYWCDDDELHHTVRALREHLETGAVRAKCGPPRAIDPIS